MSQDEIKQWLKEHPGTKYSAKQLSKSLNIDVVLIHQGLERIRIWEGNKKKKTIKWDYYIYNGRSVGRYWYE